MPSPSFIARQLQDTKALFGYAYAASHPKLENWLTETLARRIADYGFEDIREIGYGPQGFFNRTTGALIVRGQHLYDPASSYRFDDYVGDPQLWPWVTLDLFDIATNSDWFAQYYARFTADGVPYFVVVLKPQADWKDTLAEALSMAFAAASIIVPGINAVIGQALFSKATIAAYPALTTIATGTVVQTVLTGGDVERAVQLSVAAYVGGSVGNFVKGVSDSQALGALANTAAKTALVGGDMGKALASTVLRIAPDAVAELAAGESPAGPALSPVADPATVTIAQPGAIVDDYSAMIDAAAYSGNPFGDPFTVAPSFDAGPIIDPTYDATADPWATLAPGVPGFELPPDLLLTDYALPTDLPPLQYTIPTGGPMMTPPPVVIEPPGSTAPAASPFDLNSLVKNVTYAAETALRLSTAWRASKYPGINASARVVSQNGAQTVVSDSGEVLTRGADGRVTKTRPAVGEPRLTTGGNIVINRGNGTFELISSTGERRIVQYGAASNFGGAVTVSSGGAFDFLSNVSPTHVAIGLGAVGLLLALRRK